MAYANIDTFVHEDEERLLDELLALRRIPSISGDEMYVNRSYITHATKTADGE
jgi:hypothetical protein